MGFGFLLRLLTIIGLATIVAGVGASFYYWTSGSSHILLIAVALFLGTCLVAIEEDWPPELLTESGARFERIMSKAIMWVIWYPSFLVGTLGVLTFIALLLFKVGRWVLS
jgi:hypothetical protein